MLTAVEENKSEEWKKNDFVYDFVYLENNL